MEITGKVTADAVVRETKGGKKVVGFGLVLNENYLSKGEKCQNTIFFDCSYWQNEAIALYLKKGAVVHLSGMVGTWAYLSAGEAKSSLTFRVDKLTLHGQSSKNAQPEPPKAKAKNKVALSTETIENDDLPF